MEQEFAMSHEEIRNIRDMSCQDFSMQQLMLNSHEQTMIMFMMSMIRQRNIIQPKNNKKPNVDSGVNNNSSKQCCFLN